MLEESETLHDEEDIVLDPYPKQLAEDAAPDRMDVDGASPKCKKSNDTRKTILSRPQEYKRQFDAVNTLRNSQPTRLAGASRLKHIQPFAYLPWVDIIHVLLDCGAPDG